jgi:hypothetical protein
MFCRILNEQEIKLIYKSIDRTDPVHTELLNSLFVNYERKVFFFNAKSEIILLLKRLIIND